MVQPVQRLTYVSTAARVGGNLDIEALVEQARRKNAERSITGLLLYNGLNFLQTLEGPPDEVFNLFAKISDDPRHSGVVCVQSDEPGERAFSTWSMAYAPVSRAGAERSGLGANGFTWGEGSLPPHLLSLYIAFNSFHADHAAAAAAKR